MSKTQQKRATLNIGVPKNKDHTKKIWKNVLVIGLSFLFAYISYNGMASIQSSLHRDEGMGTLSTSTRYAAYTLSSLFLSTTMVRFCGHKWTITVSLSSFLFWNIANGFGVWGSMIPASIVNGLFTAPLWTAQGAYISELATQYAFLTDQKADRVGVLFFGVFSAMYTFSAIISDIVTSTVLMNDPLDNTTIPSEENIQEYCGLNDCPWQEIGNNTFFEEPSKGLIWSLVGIYTISVLTSIFISAIFLDHLHTMVNVKKQGNFKEEISSALLACLRLMKDYRVWLLVPVNWFSSILQSFWVAEFNGSWVTCALGIWMVGLISLPRSILISPVAYATGRISKIIGHVIPMIVATITILLVLLGLLFWTINSIDVWVYFMFAIGFGFSEGIIDVIVQSLYGCTFPGHTTESFALYNFFWCIIASISYGYSYYVCSDVKLYVVLFLLATGLLCFIILELDKIYIHKQTVIENDKRHGISDKDIDTKF